MLPAGFLQHTGLKECFVCFIPRNVAVSANHQCKGLLKNEFMQWEVCERSDICIFVVPGLALCSGRKAIMVAPILRTVFIVKQFVRISAGT